MHQNIEGLGNTWPWNAISFYNCFISLCAAYDVIGFQCQQFLQNIRGSIGFQCPYFHFTKPLTTELSFTTQRLLRDQTVWPNASCMHLIINHMVQLNYVDDPNRSFLVKPISGLTVIQVGMAETWQARFFNMLGYFFHRCTIENRRCEF